MIRKIQIVLSKILMAIGVVTLVGIVFVIILNVIARSFGHPILWSLEVCGILVVWSTYILMGVDFLEDRHFRIDVLDKLMSKKANRVLLVIAHTITFITLLFLGYSCIESMSTNGSMTLTALPISLNIAFYIPLAIGIATYLLFLVFHFIEAVSKLRKGN